MEEELKVGDVVKLKSGGPAMTIEKRVSPHEGSGERAWCCWFDEKNEPQRKVFPLHTLEKSEDKVKKYLT